MERARGAIGLLVAGAALALAAKPAAGPLEPEAINADVAALSAAETAADRRQALCRRLDGLGIAYRTEPFTQAGQAGTNVLVGPLGSGKVVLVGAHYDRSRLGRGAVDNASGVALVLGLLAAFRGEPLARHAVAAAFFDLHEVGLHGSEAYVAAHRAALPELYVNLETVGYGDTLFAMAEDRESPAARAVRDAASAAQVPLEIGPLYPATDHLAFLKAKVPALSFTLAPAEDVRLLKLLLDPTAGRRQREVPPLLRLIHTAADVPERVDPAAAARAAAVVEAALRAIDKLE
jgi:Zn-dependent M28 family amino/carboxypeptidase